MLWSRERQKGGRAQFLSPMAHGLSTMEMVDGARDNTAFDVVDANVSDGERMLVSK